MTSLDFLYIALGGGFLLLVVFLCVLILNLTLILRDITKVTDNAVEISDRVKEVVFEPLKTLSEMTVGFGFVHDLFEKIRAKYEEATAEDEEELDEAEDVEEKNKKGKKGGFSIRKLGK